jgi:redox-sensitive bicupin YhaK (pirin superfamily)
MQKQREALLNDDDQGFRRIVARTRGAGHGGPITRLMSPSDFGHHLKPFVFLDLFSSDAALVRNMAVHPHSGIATITVLTDGDLRFDKPGWGSGTIGYGGVEWMRAGSGVWHGDEMWPGSTPKVRGFQLWIALPAELEASPAEWQFVEASEIPAVGPARLILGEYQGSRSPVRTPSGVNYLLVTLRPGEEYLYQPPEGHEVGWLSVSQGALEAEEAVSAAELVMFERGGRPIALRGGTAGATFVLGSAVPHPHDLILGSYSVHTSATALRAGEARIMELCPRHAGVLA